MVVIGAPEQSVSGSNQFEHRGRDSMIRISAGAFVMGCSLTGFDRSHHDVLVGLIHHAVAIQIGAA